MVDYNMNMINKIFITFAFFFIFQFVLGQNRNMDNMNSNQDVENLINSFLDERYKVFKLKPIGEFSTKYDVNNSCKRISDSLNITKTMYKCDFDNNGFTDMMVMGDFFGFNIFVVMNFGNDSLQLNRLTRRSSQNCVFPKIINDSKIDFYYVTEPDRMSKEKPILTKKTLVYKFGDFVEYNKNPGNYDIEKIEYQTSMCFGTCPKFHLDIADNRKAIFNAENYNRETRESKEIQGKFETTINVKEYHQLVDLLNYINFPNLKDNYAVSWTDDQSCTLRITYNNGKTKEIKDYGLIGTYGLDRLYQLLFELRFNQDWRKNYYYR